MYPRQNKGLAADCEESIALTKATDWSFNYTNLYLKGKDVLQAGPIQAET